MRFTQFSPKNLWGCDRFQRRLFPLMCFFNICELLLPGKLESDTIAPVQRASLQNNQASRVRTSSSGRPPQCWKVLENSRKKHQQSRFFSSPEYKITTITLKTPTRSHHMSSTSRLAVGAEMALCCDGLGKLLTGAEGLDKPRRRDICGIQPQL